MSNSNINIQTNQCDSKCVYVKRKELYNPPKDNTIHIALHASYYWICTKHEVKSYLLPVFVEDHDNSGDELHAC